MAKKKEEKIDLNCIPEEEKMKCEIAEELGLLERVRKAAGKAFLPRKQGALAGL